MQTYSKKNNKIFQYYRIIKSVCVEYIRFVIKICNKIEKDEKEEDWKVSLIFRSCILIKNIKEFASSSEDIP